MEKLLLYASLLLLAVPLYAQHATDTTRLGSWLERQVAQAQQESLKSYYNDVPTAQLCESWNSCAKWAFEQYVEDQTFKIVKAKLKTQRIVSRHRMVHESRLYVQATVQNKTINIMFTSPRISRRTSSYRYISHFPKDSPAQK